ncbi:estA [Symbiodinium natans]|uniref:EstA protein n=1 Tax=Symbiodinium natans TaxID=878477 RepID=A0A812P1Q6_9DINO|nr:estA [Symbiodinium natans]
MRQPEDAISHCCHADEESGTEEMDASLYLCKRRRAYCPPRVETEEESQLPTATGSDGAGRTLLEALATKPRSNPHLPLGSDGEALLLVRRARAFQGDMCAKALAAEFLAKAPSVP